MILFLHPNGVIRCIFIIKDHCTLIDFQLIIPILQSFF